VPKEPLRPKWSAPQGAGIVQDRFPETGEASRYPGKPMAPYRTRGGPMTEHVSRLSMQCWPISTHGRSARTAPELVSHHEIRSGKGQAASECRWSFRRVPRPESPAQSYGVNHRMAKRTFADKGESPREPFLPGDKSVHENKLEFRKTGALIVLCATPCLSPVLCLEPPTGFEPVTPSLQVRGLALKGLCYPSVRPSLPESPRGLGRPGTRMTAPDASS
jgi:hypothetical protein